VVGAISHYLDHFVVGRIVRYTCGTPASVKFDLSDPEHRKRAHKMFLENSQGMRISGTLELRESVSGVSPSPPTAGKFLEFNIIRYAGKLKKPQWMDEEEGR
jgi:hypothetical protein